MKNKIRAAIVGYGNIGKSVLEAIEAADDFELVGVVRRSASVNKVPKELAEERITDDIEKLENVQVAILCTPTRSISEKAKKILFVSFRTLFKVF